MFHRPVDRMNWWNQIILKGRMDSDIFRDVVERKKMDNVEEFILKFKKRTKRWDTCIKLMSKANSIRFRDIIMFKEIFFKNMPLNYIDLSKNIQGSNTLNCRKFTRKWKILWFKYKNSEKISHPSTYYLLSLNKVTDDLQN
jgi:hypothetical protein